MSTPQQTGAAMTTSELRAAAAFILSGDYVASDRVRIEAKKLAAACLAEHPCDDEQAIDEVFLASLGFGGDMHAYGPGMWLGDLRVSHDWVWGWRHSWPFAPMDSRGQLRRLMAALGITATPLQKTEAAVEVLGGGE
jgi:hypothetical protein